MHQYTLSLLLLLLLLAVGALPSFPLYPAAALDIPPAPSPSVNGSAQNPTGSNNTTSPFNGGFDQKRYQRLTILIATLFMAFLFLGFCAHYITLRSCFNTRRHNNIDFLAALHPPTNGLHTGEEERGLEPWLVRSLPVVKYTAKKDEQEEDDGTAATAAEATCSGAIVQVIKPQECAVCLNEYEEGEEVTVLPVCWHRFHKACINMWLFSHSTCPICRLSLRKAAQPKSATGQPVVPRSLYSASYLLPRGSHVVLVMPSDPTLASTSSGLRAPVVNSLGDVGADEAEDPRNSSAALYPHFPSST